MSMVVKLRESIRERMAGGQSTEYVPHTISVCTLVNIVVKLVKTTSSGTVTPGKFFMFLAAFF